MTGPRPPHVQARHDRMVDLRAREYQAKGFLIHAELEGFSAPEAIDGVVPDLRAERDGEVVIIEVETRDTLFGEEYKQEHKTFRKWKAQDPASRQYKMVIA
jgi:hypothetical protein